MSKGASLRDRATRASTEPVPVSAVPASIPSADLFPATLEAGDIPATPRGLDLRTEFLKERYHLPDEWVWHSFEAIEDRPPFRFAKYSGGVYPFAKAKGKYKGRTDYKRPVIGTEQVVVLDDHEFEAWLPTWEARTGLCHECLGTGQKWTGWHYKEGSSYCDCPRCGTSGKAPAQGIEARQGGDANAAPSRSDESPVGASRCAQGGAA